MLFLLIWLVGVTKDFIFNCAWKGLIGVQWRMMDKIRKTSRYRAMLLKYFESKMLL